MGAEFFLLLLVVVVGVIVAAVTSSGGALQRPGKGTEGVADDEDQRPRHHAVTDEGAGQYEPEEMGS